MNTQSKSDSNAVYARHCIPGAVRPFFQAALANLNPNAATKVNYKNPARPPLLLIIGSEDRISPPSINKSNLKRQQRAKSATAYKQYPGARTSSPARTSHSPLCTPARISTPMLGGREPCRRIAALGVSDHERALGACGVHDRA